ncbi:hypothetical protein NIES3806_14470 [Microcystis aeruginosa NIES-3806]|jgi:hypothetical protein|uniref:Uncharacterized protein n=2 Tax=Microcystis aeruginosa TaxID=1126 RepID=A0A552FJS8_MICAE|nr:MULTISPECIES: hypothetical protein [Microcystis]TRU46999.1 MAG: hypothetical protein EWV91_11740 [Microcystis aeruginosa Ma_QC_Ca_00000000_S207]AVQ74141.1 hypothetical protein B5D77_25160 [Microcystis sp. MC19]MCA2938875.1 hypothetical protein [Microcystis sp. M113S1]MDB9417204.1 hypothetical protein [Microcystis aeruginosa CS-556/03]CCI33639.1 hypothetical protein MICAI_4060002 [Microcystis sp. T1-4]
MELTPEEQEIIQRFRQLSVSQKKAVLSSTHSFMEWIKVVARWILEALLGSEVVRIFEDLKKLIFG